MTHAASQPQIDVRAIPPRERHPLIFSTFGQLGAGQAMELLNDHDPKPLHQRFQADLPGQFSWNYLEQGPALWRVAITRLTPAAIPAVTPAAPAGGTGQCCGSCGGA